VHRKGAKVAKEKQKPYHKGGSKAAEHKEHKVLKYVDRKAYRFVEFILVIR
jgi:hypothetical protein